MCELKKCLSYVVGGGIGLCFVSVIVTIPIMYIIAYNLSVDIDWKCISIIMQVAVYVGGLIGLLAFVAEKSENEKKEKWWKNEKKV